MEKEMLCREEGSVLIVVLIFLVLLTIMGISATSTTNIEMQIAHNEVIAKENFYNAEAAAMESIQELDNAGDVITKTGVKTWLHQDLPVPDNVLDTANWDAANAATAVNSDNKQKYLAVYEGVDEGSSLSITGKRVYRYRVIGRGGDIASPSSGSAVVEMGFKKPL